MNEADRIANDPKRRHFSSFSEIVKEILGEDDVFCESLVDQYESSEDKGEFVSFVEAAVLCGLDRDEVLAWDPDFTKLTAKERAEMEEAENNPESIPMDALDWN